MTTTERILKKKYKYKRKKAVGKDKENESPWLTEEIKK